MSEIQNVVFDVGGVLIDYRWQEFIMDYGYDREKAYEAGMRILSDPLWRQMDKGTYSQEETIQLYKEKYPDEAGLIDYMFEETENMRTYRYELYPVIDKLFEKGYSVYILSNYSENLFNIHTKEIPFLNKCDKVLVSYKLNMLKPDYEIYQYMIDRYDMVPPLTMFLDDNEENVNAARIVGLDAHCVKTVEDVLECIKPLIEL